MAENEIVKIPPEMKRDINEGCEFLITKLKEHFKKNLTSELRIKR